MAGGAPRVGEVIPFWFLWSSEHEAGEDAGRKLRPCVVVVALLRRGRRTRLLVAPMTHARPGSTRTAILVPSAVKAHLGLDSASSWIMCDEVNEFDWPGWDVGKTPKGTTSYGFLPRGLIAAVRSEVAAAYRRGAFRTVDRDR